MCNYFEYNSFIIHHLTKDDFCICINNIKQKGMNTVCSSINSNFTNQKSKNIELNKARWSTHMSRNFVEFLGTLKEYMNLLSLWPNFKGPEGAKHNKAQFPLKDQWHFLF